MNQQELLASVLDLTHEMTAAARAGDWVETARIAQQRSPLLMQVRDDKTSATLERVREIQALDAALTKSASGAHDALSRDFRDAKTRITAASRYQQAARF